MKQTTIIETGLERTFTVVPQGGGDQHITVTDTDTGREVGSYFYKAEATQLANALLGDNATVVTDLPEVEVTPNGLYVAAGDVQRRIECYTAEDFLTTAKNYLALHAFIVKRNEEKEAAKKAEEEAAKAAAEAEKAKEAARDKRRDEVAVELTGDPYALYGNRFTIVKKAIDRIIDLEEASKV